ncbi:LysM peptidoglycan-binding domain-containing protein [Prochlorococcus marinus]|uniref:LysM peptidoglycan-binding domain-containing protein n=1 Tax=Prochlorococcus marinus TaxID=1219 RepID=UPI0022B566AE|nr:LysM peptidoglycan-binding domain-containing protein [Prochlorococcus marinus]
MALFFIMPLTSKANEVVIKEGDTLSKIADEYNVSVRAIMDANGIYNADTILDGQRIKLPINSQAKEKVVSYKTHTIEAGQTINNIAKIYRVDPLDIIKLNNIKNPNLISIGEVINLPNEAININIPTENKSDFHIVLKGDTLSSISNLYNISLEEIIKANKIINPNSLRVGSRITLNSNYQDKYNQRSLDVKDPKSNLIEWNDFGPLKINWSGWKKVNGSFVTPAIHKNGKPLFVAIHCPTSKINWRPPNGKWSEWLTPNNDFEFNLLDAICENSI